MKRRLSHEQKKEFRVLASKLPTVNLGGKDYTQAKNIPTEILIKAARNAQPNESSAVWNVQTNGRSSPNDRKEALKILKATESSYMSVPMKMNHFKNIIKAFKKGGHQEVLNYVIKYQDKKKPIIKKE